MNEHAGAACALSVLIVGVFAVLLHDKDRPPPRPAAKPQAASSPPSPSALQPAPTPAPPPIETALLRPASSPSAIVPGPEPKALGPAPEIRPVARVEKAAAPPIPRPTSPPRSAGPRGGFTVVEAGEALADVAARVYGSPGAAESLWKANRDQLAGVDTPLAQGTLLRTP